MDEETWLVVATLVRRALSSWDRGDGTFALGWQGGGYDCESLDATPAEAALIEALYRKPWCEECERFLRPGEPMWTVNSHFVLCDDHWNERRAQYARRGHKVTEQREDD